MDGPSGRIDVEMVSALNSMMRNSMPGGLPKMLQKVLGDAYKPALDVPPFHTEMAKAGHWPALCNVEECHKKVCGNIFYWGIHRFGLSVDLRAVIQ